MQIVDFRLQIGGGIEHEEIISNCVLRMWNADWECRCEM